MSTIMSKTRRPRPETGAPDAIRAGRGEGPPTPNTVSFRDFRRGWSVLFLDSGVGSVQPGFPCGSEATQSSMNSRVRSRFRERDSAPGSGRLVR